MEGAAVVYTRRRVRDRLIALLASDSVRNLIWVYYFWFIVWGLWGSLWAYPIDLIDDVMGDVVYDLWVWSPLVACPVALLGLAIRHGGSPADQIKGPLLRADFLGLWLQVGGHAWMSLVLAVYIGAGIRGAQPHQPIISVILLCAYFQGVCFLTAQCIYKLKLGWPRKVKA